MSDTNTGCKDGSKHNFKPRYTEKPNDNYKQSFFDYTTAEELRSLLIRKEYVGDVCTWCGKAVTNLGG